MNDWVDIAEYDSLRVIASTQKGRWGNHPHLFQPSRDQKLVLSKSGDLYMFRLLPEGIQIPMTNVASAIPKAASMATVRKRTVATEAPKRVPRKASTDE